MSRERFYGALRTLVGQLAALVFLARAIGFALVTMAFKERPELVLREWQAERPWHWPEQPLAPLEVGLMVCMTKTPDSPERVC